MEKDAGRVYSIALITKNIIICVKLNTRISIIKLKLWKGVEGCLKKKNSLWRLVQYTKVRE